MRKLRYRENKSAGPGLIVIRQQMREERFTPRQSGSRVKIYITYCTAALKTGPKESDKSASKELLLHLLTVGDFEQVYTSLVFSSVKRE